MTDLLEEVLDDEKQTKRVSAFRDLLPKIIILSIIVVVSTVLWNIYTADKEEKNAIQGDAFVEISEGSYGDAELTHKYLEQLVHSKKGKHSEMAHINLALQKVKLKKFVASLDDFVEIEKNTSYSNITRAYARIMYLSIILDQNLLNDETKNTAMNFMQAFKSNDQPFFASGTLLKSLFYKQNDQKDLALEYANMLVKADEVPMIIKNQAKAIIANL